MIAIIIILLIIILLYQLKDDFPLLYLDTREAVDCTPVLSNRTFHND